MSQSTELNDSNLEHLPPITNYLVRQKSSTLWALHLEQLRPRLVAQRRMAVKADATGNWV